MWNVSGKCVQCDPKTMRPHDVLRFVVCIALCSLVYYMLPVCTDPHISVCSLCIADEALF